MSSYRWKWSCGFIYIYIYNCFKQDYYVVCISTGWSMTHYMLYVFCELHKHFLVLFIFLFSFIGAQWKTSCIWINVPQLSLFPSRQQQKPKHMHRWEMRFQTFFTFFPRLGFKFNQHNVIIPLHTEVLQQWMQVLWTEASQGHEDFQTNVPILIVFWA